jgi:FkbM family methyltransferase
VSTASYQNLLRPNDHILDIGANIGYYLLVAKRVVGEGARFLAFEPVPDNFAILERNLRRLGRINCRTIQSAIGAVNDTAMFYESRVSNFGGLIQHSRQEIKREIPVDVRRLDDVLASFRDFRPTVLRMDVEGAELDVLAGGRKTLETHRPLLFIEFHPFAIGMDRIIGCLQDLQSLGYKNGILIDRGWDQPWIAAWARNTRCWRESLRAIADRLSAERSVLPVFTVIIERPSA